MLGRTHPLRDLQTFDDPRIDHLLDQCRARRIAMRKSQREVANDANISIRAVQFMENHQRMPPLSQFVRYAQACGFVLILTEFRA